MPAAILHHLLKAGELLSVALITVHNVFTMNRLMAEVRVGIAEDALDSVTREWLGG